jgi:hypothetical protein
MDMVLRKGVACGSETVEEKGDLESMPSCAPKIWGMEGSTVDDANKDPTLE